MDIEIFCNRVDQICDYQYGVLDGGDLCYNLIEMGAIDMAIGEDAAARIVAQHSQQA